MTDSGCFPRILVLGALLLALGVLDVGSVGAAQPAPNDPLRIIPADALFCVRINRLTTTLNQTDQFLTGISAASISMAVQARLGEFLGAPQPAGVNMAGDFAVFGPLPGGETPDMKRVGLLIPLSDFQQFLTNANVTKPDAQGILKIGPAGKQNVAGRQMGNYLLLTGVAHQQALTEAKNWTSGASTGSLAQRLSPDELKRATGAPAWVYANVQVVAKMYGPTIQQKLKEATKNLQQMQPKGGPMVTPPEPVIGMGVSLLNAFLQETQSISFVIDPSATAIRLTPILAAVPNTDMAKILSLSEAPSSQPNLAGYMENGAIVTSIGTFSPAFARAIKLKAIDLLAVMAGSSLSQEDIARLKELAADGADATGGAVAVAVSSDPKVKPPFRSRRIVTIRDKQKFNEVLDEYIKLTNNGAMANLLKAFGMKMQFTFQRNTETYKEVPIDAGRIVIQPIDANSPQGQMIKNIYGPGFNVRLAFVNDLLLTVVAEDPEKEIRALIDQAKSGTTGQMPSEVQAASQLLPEAKNATFFGIYNEVRAVETLLPFLPMPMPQVQVPTKSDIAFAGNVGNGRLVTDIAIPKQHVLEIKEMFAHVQQDIQGQQKEKQPGQPKTQPQIRSPGQT